MALHVALESHGRVDQLSQQKELLNQVTETLSDPDIEIAVDPPGRRISGARHHPLSHRE